LSEASLKKICLLNTGSFGANPQDQRSGPQDSENFIFKL
jgi:hypothetical protein